MKWEQKLAVAREEVRRVMESLPDPLRERLADLPVIFEHAPGKGMIRDGIAPDTMGLFVGPGYEDRYTGLADLPAGIFLFLDVIWEEAACDAPLFREEVGRTFLHEIGHYLGLGEDGLALRDLE